MSSREDNIKQVRDHVTAAVGILRVEGPEYERISWLLEDTLLLLDETQSHRESDAALENEITAIRKLLASG